jgi:hypothetical protein
MAASGLGEGAGGAVATAADHGRILKPRANLKILVKILS